MQGVGIFVSLYIYCNVRFMCISCCSTCLPSDLQFLQVVPPCITGWRKTQGSTLSMNYIFYLKGHCREIKSSFGHKNLPSVWTVINLSYCFCSLKFFMSICMFLLFTCFFHTSKCFRSPVVAFKIRRLGTGLRIFFANKGCTVTVEYSRLPRENFIKSLPDWRL
jgi:hypothetical protein